jgi:signal transduction histidine kinase
MGKLEFNVPDEFDLAQFVSVEAHDLRSPFSHVVGFSKLVLNGQDGPLTDMQKEDLTTVYQSAMRALTLLNGLIDLARLSRHEKIATLEPVPTTRVLDQAVAQWKKFNPGRRILIETDYQTLAPSLVADEAYLKEAVVSLMACAAAYTEDPARMTIQAEVEPGWQVITLTSSGQRPPQPSALEVSLHGAVGRGMLELTGGLIRSGEEGTDGATICFALPR